MFEAVHLRSFAELNISHLSSLVADSPGNAFQSLKGKVKEIRGLRTRDDFWRNLPQNKDIVSGDTALFSVISVEIGLLVQHLEICTATDKRCTDRCNSRESRRNFDLKMSDDRQGFHHFWGNCFPSSS